ncbi:hypothetical protein [Ralstonia flatus]|uniref:Uncharacterized protein n=1 Tax=Ralstonia flatus TaxID=3058601 RepID=A0AAD2BV51_9RALS|nr:hypothetical protein [Ralstonia sp. LMG 32965]CAJ0849574.1 hypothetical protein R77567_00326 [Ralstonia sp. LMG 32965]CAJ0856809.1 hypothetical protein R77564_00412 [Ralstonia sp. LMG 32965]
MNLSLNRLHGQPGGGAHASRCPNWLLPLHRARASRLTPRHGWIVIQAGGRIAKWVPAVSVTPGYKPSPNDDLSAFHGLDCELLIDDDTSCGLVRGLIAGILQANPLRLLLLTGERHPAIVILKKGTMHGAH